MPLTSQLNTSNNNSRRQSLRRRQTTPGTARGAFLVSTTIIKTTTDDGQFVFVYFCYDATKVSFPQGRNFYVIGVLCIYMVVCEKTQSTTMMFIINFGELEIDLSFVSFFSFIPAYLGLESTHCIRMLSRACINQNSVHELL